VKNEKCSSEKIKDKWEEVFAAKDFKGSEVILEIDDSHLTTDSNSLTKEQHEFELDYLASVKIARAFNEQTEENKKF
jgi:hypothetical protein